MSRERERDGGRDEMTALAETVRELREEVARLRAGQAAHHCSCVHYHWAGYPAAPSVQPYTPPYTITCESPVFSTVTTTNVPQYQTFTLSN
jgi:hypothetical protein